MKRMGLIQGAAVALAMVGMVCPLNSLHAADRSAPRAVKSRPATPAVTDVSLSANGSLSGRVVDSQGQALEGAAVVVRQGEKNIAKTVTNKDGAFQVNELRNGVYEVVAANQLQVCRLWNERTAPPAARDQVLLVADEHVVRGQDYGGAGVVDPFMVVLVGGVVATAVMQGIAIGQNNDIKDQLAKVPKSP